jgi:ubiquinone biosynthesis protein UbiJ
MQIPVAFLASIETAINAWLKLDDETLPRFARLEGKIIRLHITGLDLNLYFLPSQQGIEVLGNYPDDGEVDATIKGSPLALMRLGTSSNAGETLLKSDVEIEGDTRVAESFSAILREVDIDWEELLSRLVGDTVAHQAGQAARSSSEWVKESLDAMRMNTGEYLSEEARLTPTDSEINYFMDQVDEARMAVDRLEARIKLLLEQQPQTQQD